MSALFWLALPQAQAQTRTGGISDKMLREMEKEQELTPADKALMNAIAANAIDNVAVNHANAGALDTHFSIETRRQGITDQQQSGRCWMFSGLNVLRGDYLLRNDSVEVELSHAYLFFYDQLEKANLMLQGCIDTGSKPMDDQRVQFFFRHPVSDGGTFCGVADLTEKYGLVPREAMPETFASDNTAKARQLISSKLREFGLQLREMVQKGKKPASIEKAKTRMLSQIYHMLQYTIGEPPQKFTYTFRSKKGNAVGEAQTYTPQQFYKEVVGGKLNGTFITVMNDPRRPYYKTYEVELDRHTYDGHNWKYVNLPMDDIEQMAIAALRAGHKLYSSYDAGKMLDRKRGFADTENYDYGSLFNTTFGMSKAERISTFDSGSTHAMTLCAVDLDKKGRAVKWKVENSWGASWGQQGYLIMTDRWFREYMFRLVVPTDYVPQKVMDAWQTQPVMVMPEDPLFMPDSSPTGGSRLTDGDDDGDGQPARVRHDDCLAQTENRDDVAGARMGQQPRRLPSVISRWDSTRVYRQAVILVSFADTDFKMENPREVYDSMFNHPGYNQRKGPGCVAEYFREQSAGLFNVQFDVYGPIKVSSKAQPYDSPNANTRNYGRDVFIEATNTVIDSLQLDLAPYDWNSNGAVNQVIYVFAGFTGNQDNKTSYGHIWPNTSTFATINKGGKRISNYTASAELWVNGSSCGIGTIIHEFTHSLGLPDIYPTSSSAGYSVVDEWDLMDGGNFTNYGWCPPCYTPIEKMVLGWLTPVELTEPTQVRGLKPVSDGGCVYRIKHSDSEWLLLENIQQKGWNAGVPGKGLVVYHVYYDGSVWSGNTVNNTPGKRRFELVHADNMDYDAWVKYINSWATPKNYARSGHMNSYLLSSSPYPWTTDSTAFANDSLTSTSVPATAMNYPGYDGSTVLEKPITAIRQNADGTIDFDFMGGVAEKVKGDVNGDGTVDVADISAIISVMAGAEDSGSADGEADVNGDGTVDVADISTVISVMAGTE